MTELATTKSEQVGRLSKSPESQIVILERALELRYAKPDYDPNKTQALKEQLENSYNSNSSPERELTPQAKTLEVFKGNFEKVFGPTQDPKNHRELKSFLGAIGVENSSNNIGRLAFKFFEGLQKQGVAEFKENKDFGIYSVSYPEIQKRPTLLQNFKKINQIVAIDEKTKKPVSLRDYSGLKPIGQNVIGQIIYPEVKNNLAPTGEKLKIGNKDLVPTQKAQELKTKPEEIQVSTVRNQNVEAENIKTQSEKTQSTVEVGGAVGVTKILQNLSEVLNKVPLAEKTQVVKAQIPLLNLISNEQSLDAAKILTNIIVATENADIETALTSAIQVPSQTVLELQKQLSVQQKIDLNTFSKGVEQPTTTFSSIAEARIQNQEIYQTIPASSNEILNRPIFSTIQDSPDFQTVPKTQTDISTTPLSKYLTFKNSVLQQTNLTEQTFSFTPLEELSKQSQITNQSSFTLEKPRFRPPYDISKTLNEEPFNPDLQTSYSQIPTQQIGVNSFDFKSLDSKTFFIPPQNLTTTFSEPTIKQEFNPFSEIETGFNFAPTQNQSQIISKEPLAETTFTPFNFNQTDFTPPQNNVQETESVIASTTNDIGQYRSNIFQPPAPTNSRVEAKQIPSFESSIAKFQPPVGAANNVVSFSRKTNPEVSNNAQTVNADSTTSAPQLATV